MKYLISTPIYYVNDVPHIGSAYTTLAADVLARAHRQFGYRTRFLTGTDEHGAKIAQKAAEEGQAPADYATKIANHFKETWAALDINYDQFARTTDQEHEYLVGQVIQQLYDKEYLYPAGYEGWYCVSCEEYKDVTPNDESTSPLCDIHRKPLELVKETVYYFRLSTFQERLIELIKSDSLKITPTARKNEVLAFLEGEPLRDIPFTRSKVEWGIAVPFDPAQTVYVWVDALLYYLTFSDGQSILEQPRPELAWWPADLQIVGKDILRFHAVIWPALLLALELPVQKELFVHGFFTINGQKMSKTLGNVIRPAELIERYGVDATRYLILSAVPFGADGDISLEKLDAAYTASLANGLGNLVQRTLVLISKFSVDVAGLVAEPVLTIKEAYLTHNLTTALQETFAIVGQANQFLAEKQPWATEDEADRQATLRQVYSQLQTVAEALVPVMPTVAAQMKEQLSTLEPQPIFPRLEK